MTTPISRRRALTLALSAAGIGFASRWSGVAYAQTKIRIEVYKDPNCGCCQKWIDHMTASGFEARVTNGDTAPIKRLHGVTTQLQSCHTTLVEGFVVEGHVPASDVRRLLAEKPQGIVGLTIPGMPQSAPGMDLTPFQPYTVLAFDRQGRTRVFARHDRA